MMNGSATVVDANVVLTVMGFVFVVQSVTVYAILKLVLTRRTFWESEQFTKKDKKQSGPLLTLEEAS